MSDLVHSPRHRELIPLGAHHDDGPAVTVGPSMLTRSQLLRAATAVAERVSGAPAVAIHAAAQPETIVAVLGCLIAGVPAVPVPPDVGQNERQHLVTDSGATVWLGMPPEGLQLEHIAVELHGRSSASFAEPDETRTALILYTSGTTGAAKGAMISRAAIAAGLDGLIEAWNWTRGDVLVHGLPLFHVHGLVLGVLGALRVGSPLVHTVRPTPEAYARAVSQHSGSLVFGVPTVWSRVAADPSSARTLGHARLLVSGSAPLPISVARALLQLAGQLPVERYGMTETLITLAQRADMPRRPGWVGTPIRGVEVRVLDDAGQHVPHDGLTVGSLQVRGPTLFDGYLGRAAELDAHGWFTTGDIAAIHPSGEHKIVGRTTTDLIKSGGYRVGAGEIEEALLAHAAVGEAAVVGLPDDDLGQRIVAFVVLRQGHTADAQELIQYVAVNLSVHKRPRAIRFVDALPRNGMGKVLKRQLMT